MPAHPAPLGHSQLEDGSPALSGHGLSLRYTGGFDESGSADGVRHVGPTFPLARLGRREHYRPSVTQWTHTPASANLAEQPPATTTSCDSSGKSPDPLGIAAIIRAQRNRDFIATIAEWQRASGSDRAYWRRYVRLALAEERAQQARCLAAYRTARRDMP